jgi:hypothetical protein
LELTRLVIVGALLAILVSLGTALFHLASGKGDSGKMLKALTWRIALSVALLLFVVFAARQGWVTPNGFRH